MTLVVPNAGEGLMLEHIVGKTAVENLTLKLFKNNYTPIETSVAGDFTEATFTGYSAATLTGASWSVSTGAPSVASYAQQSFSSSADQTLQTIYGYYIVGASSGTIYWAERFPTSQDVQNNGDVIRVTPRLGAE